MDKKHKKPLKLNPKTVRTLRKQDLENASGGTVFTGITLSWCGGYCYTDYGCDHWI